MLEWSKCLNMIMHVQRNASDTGIIEKHIKKKFTFNKTYCRWVPSLYTGFLKFDCDVISS